MKIEDTLHLALGIFIHNRLRTFLTILAVGVGIGAIVFLLSLGYGFERLAIERFANDLALRSIDVKAIPDTGKVIDQAALQSFKEILGVEQVEPIVQLPVRVKVGETATIDALIVGVDNQFFDIEGYKTEAGNRKLETGKAVITTAMAQLLELAPEKAVGQRYDPEVTAELTKGDKTVTLGEIEVVGVIADNLAAAIFVPNSVMLPYAERGVGSVKILAKDGTLVKPIADEITGRGFEALTTIEDVASLEKGFRFARIILAVLGLVAVAVASIGLFNTMTISLLERIREVGIMKALGAADRDVWQIFLAESSLIGFFGGITGLLLGVLSSKVVNFAYKILATRVGAEPVTLFSTPWYFALSIMLFGLIVGVITGIYPARRASKLNPIEALRYE